MFSAVSSLTAQAVSVGASAVGATAATLGVGEMAGEGTANPMLRGGAQVRLQLIEIERVRLTPLSAGARRGSTTAEF